MTASQAAAIDQDYTVRWRRMTTYEQHAAENGGNSEGAGTTAPFEKGNTPSFSDLIDIINPLQHIPVINTIYRAVTGDHEGAVADVVGGTLYGGPLGAAAAIADLGLRDATGKDSGEHVMAWLGIDSGNTAANGTAVAGRTKAPAQVAAAAPAPAAATAPASAPKPMVQAMAAQPTPIAPAKAAAPTTMTAMAAPSAGGPSTLGDYLVFGGAPRATNAPTTAPTTAPTPVSQAAAPAPTMAAASNPPNTNAGVAFGTIGANAQPAQMLPAASAAPVSVQGATAATPATFRTAAAAMQPRVFPVPARTGPATPAQNLPPPTTGPGALPGGKSQALSAQEIAMQQQNQGFLSTYTKALEKYQNAQRLGANGPSPSMSATAPAGLAASAPTGGAPAAPLPINLIQPASDVTDGEANDNHPAVTVH